MTDTRIYLITHADGCWLKAEYAVDHAEATRLARADFGDDVTVEPVPDTDAAAIKLAKMKAAPSQKTHRLHRAHGVEEGETCGRNGCQGVIELEEHKGCSCHISPPCSACVDWDVFCPECSWEARKEIINDYVVTTNTKSFVYESWKPRPLDNTKIDWHSKSHSNSSMIKEGVYPEGTTAAEVRKLVDGTFGGRFEYFDGGKFKFIAYTD